MKQKYVVGRISGMSDVAVVFSELTVHADVARCFVAGSVESAGFFYATEDEVIPYGESTSLKLKSRPEDAMLIGMAIGHPKYQPEY